MIAVAAFIAVLLLTPLLASLVVSRWAWRVAARRSDAPVYRKLRWLPVASAVMWIAAMASGLGLLWWYSTQFLVVDASQKARIFAEAISESVNCAALVAVPALFSLVGSIASCWIGSARAREVQREPGPR